MSLWIKTYRVIIQMKVIEQYFPLVLFITLQKVILTLKSVDQILKSGLLYTKATKQYFPVEMFIIQCTRWF